MSMTVTTTLGLDTVLDDAPALRLPPMSLVDLATDFIDADAADGAVREALEKVRSSQAAVSDAAERVASAPPEDRQRAEAEAEALMADLDIAELLANTRQETYSRRVAWEWGFKFLPELPLGAVTEDDPVAVIPTEPAGQNTLPTGESQTPYSWYDPFEATALDSRSLFGFPHTDFDSRFQRAMRALIAHESWQCEAEFWGGYQIPTNPHLTCSPATVTTGNRRTLSTTYPNPTAPQGTTLGVAVSVTDSLAALVQAIADADAGLGMIHATPWLVQLWMRNYPFIRDSGGRVYTVNMNMIVPGYGYPGTGPDVASRTVTDGVTVNASSTITSATAAFTPNDLGATITGTGIPAGAYIIAVNNGTTVTMSANSTAGATGLTLVIGAARGRPTAGRQQWAYATDQVYRLKGEVNSYPFDFRQGSPLVPAQNVGEVRAQRSWGFITNQLLRAAVFVDTSSVT